MSARHSRARCKGARLGPGRADRVGPGAQTRKGHTRAAGVGQRGAVSPRLSWGRGADHCRTLRKDLQFSTLVIHSLGPACLGVPEAAPASPHCGNDGFPSDSVWGTRLSSGPGEGPRACPSARPGQCRAGIGGETFTGSPPPGTGRAQGCPLRRLQSSLAGMPLPPGLAF